MADQLGIPFHVLNFKEAFDRIIDVFCTEYLNGRTPNPCIMCNQELKFGKLLDFADMLNADFIATGHYAKVEESHNRYLLKKGRRRAERPILRAFLIKSAPTLKNPSSL